MRLYHVCHDGPVAKLYAGPSNQHGVVQTMSAARLRYLAGAERGEP